MTANSSSITDNYWSLHRNSLLSSGLLFLVSSGAISISKSQFLSVYVEEINIKSLSVLIFIVSTYMFLLYLFNCFRQIDESVYSQIEILKNEGKRRVELFEVVRQNLESADLKYEDLASRVSVLIESINSNFHNPGFPSPESIASARTRLDEGIKVAVRDSGFPMRPESFPDPTMASLEFDRRFNQVYGESIPPIIAQFVHEMDDYARSTLKESVIEFFNRIQQEISEITSSISTSISSLNNISNENHRFLSAIGRKLFMEQSRLYVSSWHIAAILYVIAILHFIGLYSPAFPGFFQILRIANLS